MRVVIFAHSLVSDWSHGNAHFLRGLMRSLRKRGHEVVGCERWRNWSTDSLYEDHGQGPIVEFARLFPDLEIRAFGEWDGIVDEVDEIARFDLRHYDGALAYGDSLGRVYRRDFGHEHVWTFHEAADTTVFYPREGEKSDDVIWNGPLARRDARADAPPRQRPGRPRPPRRERPRNHPRAPHLRPPGGAAGGDREGNYEF
ncbi:MAG TPA: hypothetical protein VFL93_16715 [Longimicrobiaceae bacterium]|jgi:spore maturation protein CgeB|nr:hypothetical protein [Longimicrobiaceae bacterium]